MSTDPYLKTGASWMKEIHLLCPQDKKRLPFMYQLVKEKVLTEMTIYFIVIICVPLLDPWNLNFTLNLTSTILLEEGWC